MTTGRRPFIRKSLSVPALHRGFRALMDEYLRTGERVDMSRVFNKIARRRLGLRAVEAPVSRFPVWARWAAPACVAVAVAAVTFSFWSPSPADASHLSYVVTANTGQRKVDRGSHRWTTDGEPLLVSFSDQSTVLLDAHTSVNLVVADSGKVLMSLERGGLHADIVHHDTTDYRFLAGVYEVKVTGTRFDLSFDRASSNGHLAMREGSVEVRGPEGSAQRVLGGQRLDLLGPKKIRPVETAAIEAEAATPVSTPVSKKSASLASPSAPRAVQAAPSYRALAKQARFAEIVADAESRGLEAVLSSKPAEELSELAHAARYVGKPDVATRVLQRVVTAYPTSGAAKNAHFFLGRIAEANHEHQRAAREYDIYVRSRPGGSYVAEALGRRMAIAERGGEAALATSLARQYLSRFPSGPYRQVALSLTEPKGGAR